MENKDQPTFPFYVPDTMKKDDGLTKRELMAAMAMQGLLASNPKVEYGDYGKMRDLGSIEVAGYSIQCADELLKQLGE